MKRPKLKIGIKNLQKKINLNKRLIADLARKILRIRHIAEAELSIAFVGKAKIRQLNKTFRKINRPTDVLAFNMREGRDQSLHPQLLGDVVICPEIAQRSARVYQTTIKREICLYLIHGILHLLGYDDRSAQGRAAMARCQQRILRCLKLKK